MILGLLIPLLVFAVVGYLLWRYLTKPIQTVALVVWAVAILAWLIEYARIG